MAASMDVWNSTRVCPPPVASCSYDCHEIEEVDVYNLKLALQVIQTSHATGLGLSSEQYTLSRLLYKANNQQRHWRWYQMLRKIQKCLNKLQASNSVKFIEDAIGCCQINHNQSGSGSITIHLPACQMLEYILVKLIGQAKLCAYILHMAEKVYTFVVQNITAGQFLAHNTIYASIVSRIWVTMRVMLRDTLPWYATLRPWADRLKATSMQWMPVGEVLPQSLSDWLKPDYDPHTYAHAIGHTSKQHASSILDNMFAAANPTTPETAISESPEGGDIHGKDVVMAASPAPSMDLGEPITAEELATHRKRKQCDLDDSQEPARKKSRCKTDSCTTDVRSEGPADRSTIVQPETYTKELRCSPELEHRGDVHFGPVKSKKQSKGILRHFKLRLKGERKDSEPAGDSESIINRESGERRTTWKQNLKKSLQRKFGKLTRNPSPSRDKVTADLEVGTGERSPVGEEQRSSSSAEWSGVVHDRKRNLTDTQTITNEALPGDQNGSACIGQVTQVHQSKAGTTKLPCHVKLAQKSKERRETEERHHEAREGVSSSIAHDAENLSTTRCPPEPRQFKTSKQLDKKTKASHKSKTLSRSNTAGHPQICQETLDVSSTTGKRERIKNADERQVKGKHSQEKGPEEDVTASPSEAVPQDQVKTNKKAVKRKGEDETDSCGFKGIFKKLKKYTSKSPLVCDLGRIARKPVPSRSNQDSEIDNIFALLQ